MAVRPLRSADVPQGAPGDEALVAREVLAGAICRETAWRFGKIRPRQVEAGVGQLAGQTFNVLALLRFQPSEIGTGNRF
jgi:hypothetical protein